MQWIASDTWYADLLVMEHKKKRIQHSLPYLNTKMLQVFEILPVASFNKEVNPRMAKRPLKINGRLADRRLTSLVKEATGVRQFSV